MKRVAFCSIAFVTACAPEAPPPAAKPATTTSIASPVVAAPLAPAAVSVPHIAPAPRADKNDADNVLAKRVTRALEEEAHIHAAAIDVTANGGVVTLWGTAGSADERQRASRVAYRVIGVTAVRNKLAIASGS